MYPRKTFAKKLSTKLFLLKKKTTESDVLLGKTGLKISFIFCDRVKKKLGERASESERLKFSIELRVSYDRVDIYRGLIFLFPKIGEKLRERRCFLARAAEGTYLHDGSRFFFFFSIFYSDASGALRPVVLSKIKKLRGGGKKNFPRRPLAKGYFICWTDAYFTWCSTLFKKKGVKFKRHV